nr:hypothetical protein [Tanacetum cinerariifolium]
MKDARNLSSWTFASSGYSQGSLFPHRLQKIEVILIYALITCIPSRERCGPVTVIEYSCSTYVHFRLPEPSCNLENDRRMFLWSFLLTHATKTERPISIDLQTQGSKWLV